MKKRIFVKKIMVIALVLISLMALLASCGTTSVDDAKGETKVKEYDTLAEVKKRGYFIVGLDDAFPPMGFRDENNEIVGFDIDLAKAVAAEMKLEVKFQPVIWDNISLEIANRNVDVIWNGCTINDTRKKVFDFSDPYMLNSQVVVVLTDSEYNSQDDLNGKIAGIQDGSSANIALDNNPDFQSSLKDVVGYPTNDKALLDLSSGRIDCVIVDITVFGHYNDIKPGEYRTLDKTLGSEEFGVAFSKDAESFRIEMQNAIDAVIASGEAAEISNKWFNSDVIAK